MSRSNDGDPCPGILALGRLEGGDDFSTFMGTPEMARITQLDGLEEYSLQLEDTVGFSVKQ